MFLKKLKKIGSRQIITITERWVRNSSFHALGNRKHSKKFKTEDTENFFESSQRELISPIPHPQGQTNPAITNSSYVFVIQSVHLFVQTTKIKNKKLNNYSYAAMISLCIYFLSITLQFAHIFNQKYIFLFVFSFSSARMQTKYLDQYRLDLLLNL